MSLLSYQLQLKRYQRELGLSDREFNALDVKHSNINLLKQLQLLNPKVSAPPASVPNPSGFWGEFLLVNGTASGSNPRHMHAYLAYNDVALTDSEQINGNQGHLFNIAEEDRLPLPNSTLQLKVTMQNNTQETAVIDNAGFTIIDITDNPLDEENTFSMLVEENNLNNGVCELTLLVTYDP